MGGKCDRINSECRREGNTGEIVNRKDTGQEDWEDDGHMRRRVQTRLDGIRDRTRERELDERETQERADNNKTGDMGI
jgi:hypothetical protein